MTASTRDGERIEMLQLILMIQPRLTEIAALLEPAADRFDAARRLAEGLNVTETAAHQLMSFNLHMGLAGYRRKQIAAELEELTGPG